MNCISQILIRVTLVALIFSTVNLKASEVATEGAEVGKWTMDYAAAAKLAREKNIPMLLNFTGSDWCGWCKVMDGNVYATPEWSEFAAKQLLLVTLDFPKDKSIVPKQFVAQNKEMKDKFGVGGYPTYIILDSDGETKLGQLGAGKEKTPASFIKEVEGILRFRKANIDAKVAALGKEKGAEYLAAINGITAAETALKDWIATEPERNDENNKKFEEFNQGIEAARTKVDSF